MKKTKSLSVARNLAILSIMLLLLSILFSMSNHIAFAEETIDAGDFNDWFGKFKSVWNSIVMPVVTTIATMTLIIAGVMNFLKLKNAQDEGEREKAKKAIFWWVFALVGSLAVLWIVPTLVPIIKGWFPTTNI